MCRAEVRDFCGDDYMLGVYDVVVCKMPVIMLMH